MNGAPEILRLMEVKGGHLADRHADVAVQLGGSGSRIARMPTSQNRDMGHPILWEGQMWATCRDRQS